MPNAAFFGLDLSAEALDGALEEERASCVVAKRVSAGRMRAAGCFAQVANPMPPPPPPSEDAAASARLAAWAERLNNNVANGTYETPTPSDEQQWLDKTAGARAGTDRAAPRRTAATRPRPRVPRWLRLRHAMEVRCTEAGKGSRRRRATAMSHSSKRRRAAVAVAAQVRRLGQRERQRGGRRRWRGGSARRRQAQPAGAEVQSASHSTAFHIAAKLRRYVTTYIIQPVHECISA